MQIALGRAGYVAAVAELGQRLIFGTGGAMGGVVAALGTGRLLLCTIRQSLREVEAHFHAIARTGEAWMITAARVWEFYPATPLLRAVRARLSFA